jgi:hypothetical protein
METKNKKKEQLIMTALSIILIIVLTVVFFNLRKNHLHTTRDRLIIFAYQTNISGSDGEEWAKRLKNNFSDIPDFEVSVYETKQAGNESITITTENGWGQIVIRLAANEGDILFVNNQTFYEVLLEQDMLVPLENAYKNPVTDENGTVYGIDVTKMTAEGLLNHGTSSLVGLGQPLPIVSIDESDYELGDEKLEPRVIAVIFKGSDKIAESQHVLYSLFGEDI